MTIEASYHSEVRFVRSSYSSKTGTTITLALPDSDELSKVQGMDGKRYMLALVEIGDDELPVQKPKGGYASKWIALRCAESAFRQFIIETNPFGWRISTDEHMAADQVRQWCQVESRADIDHNLVAKAIFDEQIRIPYMKWCVTRGVRFSCPEVGHASA